MSGPLHRCPPEEDRNVDHLEGPASPFRASGRPALKHMAWVPGGTFLMGSNDHYPEEAPAHHVTVDGFWMDEHPVTVAEFRRFVKETGYVTVAERPLDPRTTRSADPACSCPGRWSSKDAGAGGPR